MRLGWLQHQICMLKLTPFLLAAKVAKLTTYIMHHHTLTITIFVCQSINPSIMTFLLLLLTPFLLLLLVSSTATTNLDVALAVGEMQKANYFAYAMLVNMAPPDLIQANLTFLMPNDKSLSTANVAETSISDFLLRHSIPWPLLFEHMEHFPTGSLIPTSHPGLVLKVSNDGRRRFFFNNARIISPNICTKSASIRCHGIDGVVHALLLPESSCPPRASSPPLSTPPLSPPPPNNVTHRPTTPLLPPPSGILHPPAPSVDVDDDNDGPSKSGCDHRHHRPGNAAAAGAVGLVAMLWFML